MQLTTTDRKKFVTTLVELRKPLYIIAVLWGGSLAILLAAEVAKAEMLCDCTQVVGSCSATVALDGMQVQIESDSTTCSRVDYLVEGQPFAALVVGGSSQMQWPGQPLRNPAVVVENCRVCASGAKAAAPVSAAADNAGVAANDSELTSIAKILPDYPRNAWSSGAEGVVTLQFDVNAAGQVQNIRVLKATNQVFVMNAIDAVSRFRYRAATSGGEMVGTAGIKEEFTFQMRNGTDPVVTSKTL